MKYSGLFVTVIFVLKMSFCHIAVVGQSANRLDGIVQQQLLQSRLKSKIAEIELGNVELEEDGNSDIKTNLMQKSLQNFVEGLISSSFPTAVASNISQQCQNDSVEYVRNLYQRAWAMQMKESSGKVPVGLYGAGNLHADGLFDECLAVRAPNFDGQYCTAFFKADPVEESEVMPSSSLAHVNGDVEERSANLVTILQLLGFLSPNAGRVEPKVETADDMSYIFPSVSFCLPSSCSAADLGQAVAQLVGGYIIGNYSIVTVTDERYCFKENKDPPTLDGPDITVVVVLSLLGLVVVAATIHDAWRTFRSETFDSLVDGPIVSYLHCFSALTNGRKCLSFKVTKSPANLSCVHGIRVLSTLWVVIGHTWFLGPASNSVNPNMARNDAMKWWFQGITNATIAVDTFLFISGLLMSYLLLTKLDRNKGKVNFGIYYLHRYIKLTPAYAVILGFIATLMMYVGTGPNWYNVEATVYGCRVNWWKHFLYINNLFPTDVNVQCLEPSWHLALDMQLFVLSAVVVYVLWYKKNIGMALLFVLFIGTIAANFAVFAVLHLMPTLMPTRTMDTIAMGTGADYYYTKPWTRAPPYIIGVWLGWFLYATEESQKRVFSKIMVVIFWAMTLVIVLAVIYGLTPYLDETTVPVIDPAVSLVYGSLHRTAWAAAVAWIVYACAKGYGGIINRLLSWKGFLPLSRLSYCVYLIHYAYLDVFYASNRKLVYYTFNSQLMTYFGIVVTVFGLAFVVSITVEASFLNIEKLIFHSFKPTNPTGSDVKPHCPTKLLDWKNKSWDKY